MTNEELQDVVAAVIQALKTNGKTISQLTPVTTLADDDSLEVSGGKKIGFEKLKEIIASAVVVTEVAIADNLTTDDASKVLSARQGKVLKGMINTILESLGEYAFPNGKPVLYYDAEVEYLQCGGGQFIDTLIKGNLGTKLEIKFNASNLGGFAGGCRASNNNGITVYIITSGTQRFGDKYVRFSLAANTDYIVSIDKNNFTVNGSAQALNATAEFTTEDSIYLMWANNQASASDGFEGKFYYAKIWQNDTLIRDFIPVRAGQVGYLYDKVSGMMFGNKGTGSFILGNDKEQ